MMTQNDVDFTRDRRDQWVAGIALRFVEISLGEVGPGNTDEFCATFSAALTVLKAVFEKKP